MAESDMVPLGEVEALIGSYQTIWGVAMLGYALYAK